MQVNSVIFHTRRISDLRDFYEGLLNLPTGTYVANNSTVADFSPDYVNYHLGSTLLCFEYNEQKSETGTIIFNTDRFAELREELKKQGVQIRIENKSFFQIEDPEGRQIIIEPSIRRS